MVEKFAFLQKMEPNWLRRTFSGNVGTNLENVCKNMCLTTLKADQATCGCGINMVEDALNYLRVVGLDSRAIWCLIY